MEYRNFPRGNEKISQIGLGLGGIQNVSSDEIEQVIQEAISHGINFFDLCAGGKNVYAPVGQAFKGLREKVRFQLHFGAVYNEKGEYAWSRKRDEIKRTVEWELETLLTDSIDFGMLHCLDDWNDYQELVTSGVQDYLISLKEQGVVRHLGFSSHTPSVARKILDTNLFDMLMFSINPAYDYERGDEYGTGTVGERKELYRYCAAEGIGLSVMKPFFAGKLLSAETSPFRQPLSRFQCLQYALDRPGVLSVVPGVQNLQNLHEILGFSDATTEEKDYSIIGSFDAHGIEGNCVYCNHCQPCPAGIDVGLVNKYYDLAQAGDQLAIQHYDKLSVKADSCRHCGHCDNRCPFHVQQGERMTNIVEYFDRINSCSKK